MPPRLKLLPGPVVKEIVLEAYLTQNKPDSILALLALIFVPQDLKYTPQPFLPPRFDLKGATLFHLYRDKKLQKITFLSIGGL